MVHFGDPLWYILNMERDTTATLLSKKEKMTHEENVTNLLSVLAKASAAAEEDAGHSDFAGLPKHALRARQDAEHLREVASLVQAGELAEALKAFEGLPEDTQQWALGIGLSEGEDAICWLQDHVG